MLSRLFFRKSSKPLAAIACDMPAHKGFTATVTLDSWLSESATFPTLKEAQIWVMQKRQFADSWVKGLADRGVKSETRRAYTIRNLETGKFAPYMWQLVKTEIN